MRLNPCRNRKCCKNIPFYLPHEWVTIAKTGKRTEPKYEVYQKNDIGFIDWKQLATLIMSNRNKDVEGNVANWRDIKWIRYEKSNPFVIKIKTDFDNNFLTIKVLPRKGRHFTTKVMK